MLVDRVFGAELLTMFTVDYEPGGSAQVHDHPFEETYFFLDGEIEAELDGEPHTIRAGDVVFAGRRQRRTDSSTPAAGGCAGSRPRRRNRPSGTRIDGSTTGSASRKEWTDMAADGCVVVIGGNRGIGREIAKHYADAGTKVVISATDAARAAEAAGEIGGDDAGIGLDLAQARDDPRRAGEVGPVRYLVAVAIDRDDNRVGDYSIERAIHLVTLKLVGYTEVVHALRDRLGDESAIVLFGGLAKDRPYPGSTTVSTVNGGIVGLVLARWCGSWRRSASTPSTPASSRTARSGPGRTSTRSWRGRRPGG